MFYSEGIQDLFGLGWFSFNIFRRYLIEFKADISSKKCYDDQLA